MSNRSCQVQRLRRMTRAVVECPSPMRRLMLMSVPDRLAVALILDRRDLFVDGDFTILQAIEYLGPERLQIALEAQTADMMSMED
jgi:hypothetical protein